jgi:hypothetical protein
MLRHRHLIPASFTVMAPLLITASMIPSIGFAFEGPTGRLDNFPAGPNAQAPRAGVGIADCIVTSSAGTTGTGTPGEPVTQPTTTSPTSTPSPTYTYPYPYPTSSPSPTYTYPYPTSSPSPTYTYPYPTSSPSPTYTYPYPTSSPSPTYTYPYAPTSSPSPSASFNPILSGSAAIAVNPDGSTQYEIVLRLEPNNGNLIAADTYLLNTDGHRVKQVGHADVANTAGTTSTSTSNSAPGNTSTSTTGGNGAAADFVADASSPFQFELTFSGDPTTAAGSQATLVQDALFSGTLLSNQTVSCRVNRTQ